MAMSSEEIVERSALFRKLDAEARRLLARDAKREVHRAGEIVIREGETSTDLWLIGTGRAEAIRMDGRGGGRVTLNAFRDGDYFGEMSFIDGRPRSAAVVAATDLETLRISRRLFDGVVRNPMAVVGHFMKDLSAKVRKASAQIEDLAFVVSREKLHDAHRETIHRLALAAEYKDGETGAHLDRVSFYSQWIARRRGLSVREVENIRDAAPMHDIGKIGIPEAILRKPGALDGAEREMIETHPVIGERILGNPGSDLMRRAREIAGGHHERFDGKGYPRGPRGEAIPISARIVALADVFDALTTARPYKPAFSLSRTLDIIRKERGRHFDPELVDVFVEGIDEIADRLPPDADRRTE